MRGETGGDSLSRAKVPSKFNIDKDVEIIQKTFSGLPTVEQEAIAGIYLYRMTERRLALIINVTRHVVRVRLSAGYQVILDALSTR